MGDTQNISNIDTLFKGILNSRHCYSFVKINKKNRLDITKFNKKLPYINKIYYNEKSLKINFFIDNPNNDIIAEYDHVYNKINMFCLEKSVYLHELSHFIDHKLNKKEYLLGGEIDDLRTEFIAEICSYILCVKNRCRFNCPKMRKHIRDYYNKCNLKKRNIKEIFKFLLRDKSIRKRITNILKYIEKNYE